MMESQGISGSPPARQKRLAINGFGRIGRCFLRALYSSPRREEFSIALINEPADTSTMRYLTRFDSTHGPFPGVVSSEGEFLVIDSNPIPVCHATTPEDVNWRAHDIDMVVECSGRYGSRYDLERFLGSGCPRLLLSHPGESAQAVDRTVVYGINHAQISANDRIISSASCTTNAIVPILGALDQSYGVKHALMTTLHSVMNDQPLIDGYHTTDLRLTRSAMQSMIPVATGLAKGVERLMPHLKGRVQAKAVRVPILNVSAIDLVVELEQDVAVKDVNTLFQQHATGPLKGLLGYSEEPHASIDFNNDPHSGTIDGSQTRVIGNRIVNVFVWFDNEWGFANRMLDVAYRWAFGRDADVRRPLA